MRIEKDKLWVAFFSHTGSEIVAIAQAIGRWPDLIVTDAPVLKWHPAILDKPDIVHKVQSKPKADVYFSFLGDGLNTIVTLHGWMNIVPKTICERYDMYNGHPGLVPYFNELKGKDAQEKVIDRVEEYSFIGSIVHRVAPQVDSGEIMTLSCTMNPGERELVYSSLRHTSLVAWLKFIFQVE